MAREQNLEISVKKWEKRDAKGQKALINRHVSFPSRVQIRKQVSPKLLFSFATPLFLLSLFFFFTHLSSLVFST